MTHCSFTVYGYSLLCAFPWKWQWQKMRIHQVLCWQTLGLKSSLCTHNILNALQVKGNNWSGILLYVEPWTKNANSVQTIKNSYQHEVSAYIASALVFHSDIGLCTCSGHCSYWYVVLRIQVVRSHRVKAFTTNSYITVVTKECSLCG